MLYEVVACYSDGSAEIVAAYGNEKLAKRDAWKRFFDTNGTAHEVHATGMVARFDREWWEREYGPYMLKRTIDEREEDR